VIIGGLLVLVLTAALVGPYFIDWGNYRADFEREASVILGRDVKVNGEARARLLPFPSVTFTDVSVAGTEPGAPAMTAEEFSMDIELAPFMRGEVLIFDMRLVRPDMVMAISQEGGIDWAIRPEAYFDASSVSLEKLTVVEGRLRLRHGPSGREHVLTEINTDISARALTGPWRIDGSMRLDGMRQAVNISTGTVGQYGTMRLRLRAAPERYPLSLEADGGVSAGPDGIRYSGDFAVAIGELNQPEPAAGEARREAAAAYRLRGNFDMSHRRLDIGEFRLETGPAEDPYTADGTAFVDFGREPHFSVKADGAQLRLEEGPAVEGEAAGIELAERLAAVREFLRDLPLPGMPGSVEVNLPALVAGDTTLRDIRLNAMPVAGGWQVDALHASLPGRTTLEGNGLLTVEDALDFRGSLLLAVGQPSGFAGWLSSDVNDAIRRLPAAGFSAQVDLSQGGQRFSDLELILGGARFRGSIERDTPRGVRPSLRVDLDGESLDVDGMMAFAALFVGQDGYRRLTQEDIDLNLKAGPVSAFGLSAESVDTALRLREEAVEIDRLMIGGLEGTTISATGTLRQLGARPAGNIDADLVSVDMRPLLGALERQFPERLLVTGLAERSRNFPELFTDAKLGMVMSAAPDGGLAISAHGRTAALDFTSTLSGSAGPGAFTELPMELAVEASSADAAGLYALYGLPALPLGLAGGASTELSYKGVPARGGSATMSFTGEGLNLSFDGDMVLANGVQSLTGKASLEAQDLEPWLMTAAVSFPGAGLGLPVSLAARIDHGPDLTVISELSGEIAGAALSGDLNLNLVEGLPNLTGEIDVASLDLRPAVEMVLGTDALETAPEGGWPRAVFRSRAELPISLDLALSTRRLTVAQGWQADDVTGRFGLGQSGLRLSDIAGSAMGGRVGGLVELGNNEGSGFLSAQLKLDDISFDEVLPGGGLSGRADAGVSVTTTGKTVEAMVASLAGSGTIAYRDLTVAGINPDPLAAIIAEANRIGRDIGAEAVGQFAPRLLRNGALAAGSGEAAFSIANGVMRAPPIRIETDKASTTADVRLDLGARTLSADATVEYDPGEEELVGSTPTVRFSASGPIADPVVTVDTAPLSQFLTQRALEIEQRRVEAMQAGLLEGQRLRREVRYYAALEEARIAAEQERLRQEAEREQLRQRLREKLQQDERERAEQQRRAEEEARQREAEQARRQEAQRVVPQALPAPPPSDPSATAPAPLPSDRPGIPFQIDPPASTSDIFSPDNLKLDGPGIGGAQTQ